jgi:hypothetical protein
MADVNTTDLREPDPIAADGYVDGGGKVIPIPPKGTYTLTTTNIEWGADRDGYLQATMTHKVNDAGKAHDQHEVRYHRISTKKWPNREASSMGDYIRAFGVRELPTSNTQYQAVVNSLAGRPFEAGLDWEIYNQEKGVQLKGMDSFPETAGGGRQDWVPDPTEKGKKLYARARVSFTVSKVK